MSHYIRIADSAYPLTEQQIRAENPHTSYPQIMPRDIEGYGFVQNTAPPAIDPITQSCTEAAPALVNDTWTQQWQITDLPAEQAAANLATAKALKWEQIKAERDRRKDGGTLVAGKWFHSDRDSRIQQIGLVLMGASIPTVEWKTMDGTFVTMSQTLAGGIFAATAALDMALFQVAELHNAAMQASATPDSYDFSGNWPAHYQG